jgi:hypothetical protein
MARRPRLVAAAAAAALVAVPGCGRDDGAVVRQETAAPHPPTGHADGAHRPLVRAHPGVAGDSPARPDRVGRGGGPSLSACVATSPPDGSSARC